MGGQIIMSNLLSIASWGRLVGVSRQRAWQWVKAGRVKVQDIGGVKFIFDDEPRPEKGKSGRPREDAGSQKA
jgi:predicted site-specific integrase-resolvase